MNEQLELRMYCFVPYQLTGIQKGIQALHGVVEYANLYGESSNYYDWANNYKTVILLDGGTTRYRNDSGIGTINKIREDLVVNAIPYADFREEDLNYALTAVCFLADSRVFDKDVHPDFVEKQEYEKTMGYEESTDYIERYNTWLTSIGGKKNRLKRELLDGVKLA